MCKENPAPPPHFSQNRVSYRNASPLSPPEIWQQEKSRFEEEAKGLGKSPQITEQIIDGKLKAHFGPLCLLSQPFVKDQDKTVGEVIQSTIGKFGENIKIERFIRFEI